ncbi:MAG TPA: DUF2085 domain-containing protein [Candidatus Dojkabacteria bacterium]|nr:DUF2085 domain-containing protein [Candidatus Dojkabacteria bacterium]HQF36242.1 DUF2085 domain-containing protein [Candidatus Dojkabacteria bacterium]
MTQASGDKTLKAVVYGIGIFFVLYNLVAWLAPIFMLVGLEKAGKVIYTIYSPLCHQLPERSTYIGGEAIWPTSYNLYEAGYTSIKDDSLVSHINDGRDFYGNEKIGYKVAFCSRDLGIYTALIIVMLLVFLTKINFQKINLFLRIFLLFPMAIDGGVQLISSYLYELGTIDELFYQSNNPKRIITGMIFGAGVALLLFPYVKEELNEGDDVAET